MASETVTIEDVRAIDTLEVGRLERLRTLAEKLEEDRGVEDEKKDSKEVIHAYLGNSKF